MNIEKTFKGLVNICTNLAKIVPNIDIVVSNGVFMCKNERAISIITFTENVEKDAIIFLIGKYTINPHIIVALNKYFSILNIVQVEQGLKLIFSSEISATLLNSKDDLYLLQVLHKEPDETLSLILSFNDSDNLYPILTELLTDIDIKYDFSKSAYSKIDTSKIMATERAVDMYIGDFYIRIGKSMFGNVNKNDNLSIRCTPHRFTDVVFLVTTTNCKDKCKIINLYNAVKLR